MDTGRPVYKDVATLRREMKARDKNDVLQKDVEEGVAFVMEEYMTTEPAALAFVHYMKGITEDDPEGSNEGGSLETMHRVFNEETGEWEDGPLAT